MREPCATQNLLRDALHPFLQIVVDVGCYVVFWHRRLLDENQSARHIPGRQHPACSPHHCPTDEQRNQEMEVAATHKSQVMRNVEAFPALLF